MKFIGRFIFQIFSNAIAIMAAAYFVPGFIFNGAFIELSITAGVLTVINTFIRPLVKLILGPFVVLTFGLFIIIINAVMLYLLDIWSPELTIQGMIPLLWGTLIIGFVNLLVGLGAKTSFGK